MRPCHDERRRSCFEAVGNGVPVVAEKAQGLPEISVLVVVFEVMEMRPDGAGPLLHDVCHYFLLVIGFGFAFLDSDRSQRAFAQAGAEPVAEEVANQPRLSVYYLQCPFRAAGNAVAAAVAQFLIDIN